MSGRAWDLTYPHLISTTSPSTSLIGNPKRIAELEEGLVMTDSIRKKPPRTALLLGLEGNVEKELARALSADGCQVVTEPGERVDIVFCGHARPAYQTAVQQFANLPVIVTSRLPEIDDWLDALEAGAADYCAAPFEPTQMRWLLDIHLSSQPGTSNSRQAVA
jgi:CheY-like chemotaxis protein